MQQLPEGTVPGTLINTITQSEHVEDTSFLFVDLFALIKGF